MMDEAEKMTREPANKVKDDVQHLYNKALNASAVEPTIVPFLAGARIIEQAIRQERKRGKIEGLREAAGLTCTLCFLEHQVIYTHSGWAHPFKDKQYPVPCKASDIRDRAAELEKENESG